MSRESPRYSPEELDHAAFEWGIEMTSISAMLRQAAADARTLAALREWFNNWHRRYEREGGSHNEVRCYLIEAAVDELDRLMARPDGAEETQG